MMIRVNNMRKHPRAPHIGGERTAHPSGNVTIINMRRDTVLKGEFG